MNIIKQIRDAAKRVLGKAITACGLIGLLALAPAASGQGFATRQYFFTNGAFPFPLKLTNGQSVTFASTSSVPVFRDRGTALWANIGGTNVNSITNLTLTYNVKNESGLYGTNTSTSGPIKWLLTGPGNGQQIGYTNMSKGILDNANKLVLTTILWPAIGGIVGADTNTIWITNLWATAYP